MCHRPRLRDAPHSLGLKLQGNQEWGYCSNLKHKRGWRNVGGKKRQGPEAAESPAGPRRERGTWGFRTEALIPAWLMSRLSGQQAFPQPGQDLRHNHEA